MDRGSKGVKVDISTLKPEMRTSTIAGKTDTLRRVLARSRWERSERMRALFAPRAPPHLVHEGRDVLSTGVPPAPKGLVPRT